MTSTDAPLQPSLDREAVTTGVVLVEEDCAIVRGCSMVGTPSTSEEMANHTGDDGSMPLPMVNSVVVAGTVPNGSAEKAVPGLVVSKTE